METLLSSLSSGLRAYRFKEAFGGSFRPLSTTLLHTFILSSTGAVCIALAVFLSRLTGLAARGIAASVTGEVSYATAVTFLLLWPAYVLLSAAARLGMLAVLGESARSFEKLADIAGRLMIVPYALALLQHLLAALVPYGSTGETVLSVRFYATGAVVFAAWMWEAAASVRAYKIVFSQNTGRAVLTWLSFFAAVILVVWLLIALAALI